MKLYQRPRTPYWWARGTVAGEEFRFSTKRTSRKEAKEVAEAFQRRRLDEVQKGVLPELTIREALDRYLRDVKRSANYRTQANRADKLTGQGNFGERWHIAPDTKLHMVTSNTVSELRSARVSEGNADNTINHEVALLQRVYNLARDTWGVRTADRVAFPKVKVSGKLRYLSRDEEQRLLAELDPQGVRKGLAPVESRSPDVQRKLQDQYDLVVTLLDTGCRYGEATDLVWECVDTREWRWINVYRTKVGNEGLLPVSGRLRSVLERRWKARGNSPYLFTGGISVTPRGRSRGTLVARGHATKGIMRAYVRAGINAPHLVKRYGKATVHTLRDTFASRLAEAGYPLQKIQRLLGHTTPTMTQKYAKFSERGAVEEAALILNRIQEVA